jgi:hypothetical protein
MTARSCRSACGSPTKTPKRPWALAADWVAESIADRISLEWNGVADARFNANALGG